MGEARKVASVAVGLKQRKGGRSGSTEKEKERTILQL